MLKANIDVDVSDRSGYGDNENAISGGLLEVSNETSHRRDDDETDDGYFNCLFFVYFRRFLVPTTNTVSISTI